MKYDYDRYKKCIYELVHYYFKCSSFSFDELLSAGNDGFMYAVNTYDETKGAEFITYLHHCVKNKILNYINKKDKLNKLSTGDISILSSKPPDPEQKLLFKDLIDNMSQEAREVVETVLNTPKELIDIVREMTCNREGKKHLNKSNITEFFRRKGWPCKVIEASYLEISKTFGWS